MRTLVHGVRSISVKLVTNQLAPVADICRVVFAFILNSLLGLSREAMYGTSQFLINE